jgi:hypothetical protein
VFSKRRATSVAEVHKDSCGVVLESRGEGNHAATRPPGGIRGSRSNGAKNNDPLHAIRAASAVAAHATDREEENHFDALNSALNVERIGGFHRRDLWKKTFVSLHEFDCQPTDRCFLYSCYGNPHQPGVLKRPPERVVPSVAQRMRDSFIAPCAPHELTGRRRSASPAAQTGPTQTLLVNSKIPGKAVLYTTFGGERDQGHTGGETHLHRGRDWLL